MENLPQADNNSNTTTELKQMDKIYMWEEKLRDSLDAYAPVISEIDDNYNSYKGTRGIVDSEGTPTDTRLGSVRKVTFELIESQVDVTIPMPKVISAQGNTDRAQMIEYVLKNKIDTIAFEEINDEQARITPIVGASIFMVEWDNNVRSTDSIGDLKVRNIHPRELIPQKGVFKLDDMDYCFLQLLESKLSVKQRYGVEVEEEDNTEQNDVSYNEDLVTHNYAFYRNENGAISLFSWIGNTVVQDLDDYFARKQLVCSKCGEVKTEADVCTCGNEKWKLETLKNEKMTIKSTTTDPLTGEQVDVDTEIEVPYYIPKKYPFIIRKNVSELDNFLGSSDVAAIKDQQNDLNIYTTKIREKLLKGGSIITLPEDMQFKANNSEMKIVRLKNPAEKALIDVMSLQPNINNDLSLLELTYNIARQTIGITDSFQGRKSSSALSGKAKEIDVQQTAGRLESKRKMRDFAFSQLFELMFQFLLAYTDEPRVYNYEDGNGETQYDIFDKRLFIEQDKNGDYYYDDDFIFSTDISATLSTDRHAMWEETRLNFTSGGYGDPTDIQTIVMFWQTMDALHYPGAKQALRFATMRAEQQQQQMQQQQTLENQQAQEKLNISAVQAGAIKPENINEGR